MNHVSVKRAPLGECPAKGKRAVWRISTKPRKGGIGDMGC